MCSLVAEIQNEHIHFQIYCLCTKKETNWNFESAQSVVTVRHIPFKVVMFAMAAIVYDMTFFKASFYFFFRRSVPTLDQMPTQQLRVAKITSRLNPCGNPSAHLPSSTGL